MPDTPVAARDELVERLRKAADYIAPYLIWTVGPESPGYHPTMPSAVSAFLCAFDIETGEKRAARAQAKSRAALAIPAPVGVEPSDAQVEAAARVLIGRVNAPEQEIYRAARDALRAALSSPAGEQ